MKDSKLPFSRKNYRLMVIGLVVLFSGFVIMASDSEPYGFGFLGITLGPIVVMSGFIIEIVAILQTSEKKS